MRGRSSGAAVSVADGMATAAIGSDTVGSIRVPAALCGIVGFKPTQRKVPRQGAIPLSTTLDSIGPLARKVEDCALVHGIISGEAFQLPDLVSPRGLRLAIPTDVVLDGLDAEHGDVLRIVGVKMWPVVRLARLAIHADDDAEKTGEFWHEPESSGDKFGAQEFERSTLADGAVVIADADRLIGLADGFEVERGVEGVGLPEPVIFPGGRTHLDGQRVIETPEFRRAAARDSHGPARMSSSGLVWPER